MKRNKMVVAVFVASFVLLHAYTVQAGAWSWGKIYKMPEKNVNTVLIIGNYTIPRLIAELVQEETRQPIVVIPASGEGNVTFMPADLEDKTLEISLEDFSDFINFLNPEKIVVLGDRRYVPDSYIAKLDPRQTVITVTNRDWSDVAKTTSRILDLKYLIRDFRAQQELIASGKLYRPSTSNARGPQPTEQLIPDSVAVPPVIVEEIQITTEEPAQDILEEPKLIDETYVVPK
ncbi:MAG: hypothetical protein JW808_04200 [Victivallales bacterium]|nr:hypothetical protein [Victivallales bacterium]